MEDVKEYLPLYIGQKFVVKGLIYTQHYELCGFNSITNQIQNAAGQNTFYVDEIKLILRRLDSMTEEEKAVINEMELNNSSYPTMAYALAPHFKYLLSKGFWLFDPSAFDKGLIIDSKTLNKEV